MQASAALQQLLKAHDPMPAFVIDAQWNLLRFNRGGKWLATTLVPWAADLMDTGPTNLLDALVHPEGFTKPIVNLDEVGPIMLSHLEREAATQPALLPKVAAFAELLRSRLGVQNLHSNWLRPTSPVLTTRYATAHGELAFFSMFTTFGTPQDITLASLRVEHLFAADATTHTVLRAHVR